MAVAIGAIHHLFGGFEIGKSGGNHVETQESEHAVPCAGTEGGVEQEFTEVHARQTRGNTDELTHARHQSSHQSGNHPVVAEETFALFDCLPVDQQHFCPFCLCQSVDDRASEPIGQRIVDESAEVCSQSGHHHDQNDVERALLRQPRGGRNDGFRRKGNKRAFDGHADEDDPIAEVVEYPKDDSCHEERGRDERKFGRKKRKIGRKCKNGVRGRASFAGRLLFRPTKLIYRRGGYINYGAVAFTSVGLFF